MKWFKGNIPEAISAAKSKSSVFIVYIEGEDDLSKKMVEVWEDVGLSELCEKEDCVGLKLKAGSEPCVQFSQIYPVVCIPCTFVIGNNGVPVEVVGGHLEPSEFKKRIQGAVQANKDANASTTVPPPAEGASSHLETSVFSSEAATPTDAQPTPAIGDPEPVKEAVKDEAKAEESKPVPHTSPPPLAEAADATTTPDVNDRVKTANELIEQRRREKAEQEKEKAKEAENERRKLGQDMNKFKQMKCDMEAEEIKQARLKEKREAKLAKERVRQQIAQDRAERSARYQEEKDRQKEAANIRTAEAKQATEAAAQQADKTRMFQEDRKRIGTDPDSSDVKRTKWETARLQFRLPDGSAINHQFQSSDTLQTARDFLVDRVASLGRFTMRTSYPKRTFEGEDFSKSLLELELAPSAGIIILPVTNAISQVRSGGGESNFFMWLLWPLMTLWSLFSSLFFGSAPSSTTPPPSRPEEPAAPQPGPSGVQSSSGRNRPKSSYGMRQRREGNMHRLSAEDDDEDRTTWNGNSTQQL